MTIDDVLTVLRDDLHLAVAPDPDTPLISTGLIDSFHIAALVAALHTRHRVQIDLAEIGADNFDTARQMLQFIQARR